MPATQKSQNNMSFLQSVKSLFKNWNVFSKTCSRKEFWYGQIFLGLSMLFIGFIVALLKGSGALATAPKWFTILFVTMFIFSKIFLDTLYWTQFVRRYHGVGLSGQYFWLNILANVFTGLGDKIPSSGIVLDIFGWAILIVCYIIASLPDGKFKEYKTKK